MAWFIVVWNIADTRFIGPYETEESAIEMAKEEWNNDETENVAIMGPVPLMIIPR